MSVIVLPAAIKQNTLVFTIRQGTVKWLLAVAVLMKVCREEFSSFGRDVFPPFQIALMA